MLAQTQLSQIIRWLSVEIPEADVQDYLWQKTLYPGSVPASVETLAIEQAVAREILRTTHYQHSQAYALPVNNYEPILASGLAITQLSPAQSLLMLLDGLQPWGVATLNFGAPTESSLPWELQRPLIPCSPSMYSNQMHY